MSSQIYQMITDRIVSIMQQGVIPWRKGWTTEGGEFQMPKNYFSRKEYRGINIWLLGVNSYPSPWWLTFKQAESLGGHVRKGEKGFPVIFWSQGQKTEPSQETGEAVTRKYSMLRYYTVFNLAQVEGIEVPPRLASPAPATVQPFSPIDKAQAHISAMPKRPTIEHGAHFNPAYSPTLDLVKMPLPHQFVETTEYYAAAFHELVHSTGHSSRLARPEILEPNGYGTDPYAREELVAELGAAYLCALAGIERETIDNAAAYLAHWVKVLRANPRWLVTAAAQAQRATDYIRGISYEIAQPRTTNIKAAA